MNQTGLRRVFAVLAVLAVIGATLLTTAPAQAGSATWRAVITFNKSPRNPANSRISWTVVHLEHGKWVVRDHASWRAGSGMLGRAGRNSCAKGLGWLPNGDYAEQLYDDYEGSLIKGRAFRISDHRCHNGTLRQDLFIHSEQGSHNTQCPNRPGDQACRWEYPKINDYKSRGCIKMSPGDLASLVRHYHRFFRAGARYPMSRVMVRVVS
ncbi:MAG: hypothetical protein M3Z50_01910 [Actinomycetota bacterium]|nr:hypothetical protein [Actinomycetota bacterium]